MSHTPPFFSRVPDAVEKKNGTLLLGTNQCLLRFHLLIFGLFRPNSVLVIQGAQVPSVRPVCAFLPGPRLDSFHSVSTLLAWIVTGIVRKSVV